MLARAESAGAGRWAAGQTTILQALGVLDERQAAHGRSLAGGEAQAALQAGSFCCGGADPVCRHSLNQSAKPARR